MKIFINPGHAPNGQPDPGACNPYTGLQESEVAFCVGEKTVDYLNAVGIDTECLQSDSLAEICSKANSSEADLFISIHCNSAGTAAANGTETWACAGSAAGRQLAQCINDQIVDALDTTDRGVKIATPGINGLYVLSNTDMPAVLVELAFISNAEDVVLLTEQQDEFARAIARGVTDYFN
ncbi:MAG: N-acetylmuramoyl-L-alanine amidase [Lachnospiraceae bacterium]|nr:N-acetylmuramoyl-L-alanine amidase [Lachnospiraceae bacterium]